MKPSNSKVPRHIGIILDGNRRFARRLILKPFMGHQWGAEKVKKLLDWCKELDVREVTLYAFSYENFNRPRKEFSYLMNLFRKEFDDLKKDHELEKYKFRINFIGRIWMFPKDIQEKMHYLMNKSKKYKKYIVNFAMAYGGRQEVIDATKKIAEQVKKGILNINRINEEVFAKNLYMSDEPEMIIRTGGEKRTSNFLNFQAAYSEWFYLEKLWPEFEKEDFIECIEEYQRRERRFGK